MITTAAIRIFLLRPDPPAPSWLKPPKDGTLRLEAFAVDVGTADAAACVELAREELVDFVSATLVPFAAVVVNSFAGAVAAADP